MSGHGKGIINPTMMLSILIITTSTAPCSDLMAMALTVTPAKSQSALFITGETEHVSK